MTFKRLLERTNTPGQVQRIRQVHWEKTMTLLTDFQRRFEERLSVLLEVCGRTIDERTVQEEQPNYGHEFNYTPVKIVVADTEIWVSDDEVALDLAGDQRVIEVQSYRDEGDRIDATLDILRRRWLPPE